MRTANKNNNAISRHLEDDDLISYLDGELLQEEQERARLHLESCWSCRTRLTTKQTSIENFVRVRQDVLLPRQLPPSGPTMNLFRHRLSAHINATQGQPRFGFDLARQGTSLIGRITTFYDRLRLKIHGFGFAVRWRFVTVTAALFLVFAGLIAWFAISPLSSISASEILSESERRTWIWENQPDKVLQRGWETTFSNHPSGLPDGKYHSLNWQNNTGGKSLRLNRLYDENGVLIWAAWIRADGSQVVFSHFPEDEIRIYPATDALRAYAAGLDAKSREVLEKYIGSPNNAKQTDPDMNWQIKLQILSPTRGNVQIIQTADAGKVFRIQNLRFEGKDKSIRVETEADFAADSFMRIRIRSVRYYPDGKIATEDSELKFYRETSIEDFNANDLSTEMRQVKRIVQVAPEEILKRVKRIEEEKRNRQEGK